LPECGLHIMLSAPFCQAESGVCLIRGGFMQTRSLRLVFVAALCSAAAYAQIGTSTLTGRVTDPTGAVVARVQVTAVQTSTNFTSNTVTNEEGLYRVLSLQPGVYRVTFEAPGFKKA